MSSAGPHGSTATRRKREKPQLVADELRRQILSGELADGESIGNEGGLIERFGVSRPSLREALRILETEGLITVVRGVLGGVVVHTPDERQTARSAALVLEARNVPLADVFDARTIIEPASARLLAAGTGRSAVCRKLRSLIDAQEAVIDDPAGFGTANARFHQEVVALAGNQTLVIVYEMLREVVERAVTEVSRTDGPDGSTETRLRGVKSQRRLVELIEQGDADGAEAHWRTHMEVVGKVLLGQKATTVVELIDHL